jgi:hypothetical protein
MVVESRRGTFAVNVYQAEGQRFYTDVDQFREEDPPNKISLFWPEDEVNDNMLLGFDLANIVAHRVAHLNNKMKSMQEHILLKADLMSHLWNRRNDNSEGDN